MAHTLYWSISAIIVLILISLFITGLAELSKSSEYGTALTFVGGIGTIIAAILIFFLRPSDMDDL